MGIETPRKLPATLVPPANEAGRSITPAAGFDMEALALVSGRPTPLAPRLDLEEDDGGGESGVVRVGGAWEEVHRQMEDAFTICDYDRALFLAERYLTRDPHDPVANVCATECRGLLEEQLLADLAPLDRVVVLRIPMQYFAKSHFDHRGAFLLSHADGSTTIEDLLDLASMPKLDALRFIRDWYENGYVAFRER